MAFFIVTPVRTSYSTYKLEMFPQKIHQFLILLFFGDEKCYVKVRISTSVS
jgi:hypothetical protein